MHLFRSSTQRCCRSFFGRTRSRSLSPQQSRSRSRSRSPSRSHAMSPLPSNVAKWKSVEVRTCPETQQLIYLPLGPKSSWKTQEQPQRSPTNVLEQKNKVKHVIFLDLDNWPSFFNDWYETNILSTKAKEWTMQPDLWIRAFCGVKCKIAVPSVFCKMQDSGDLKIEISQSRAKNAADHAMTWSAAILHHQLPVGVRFRYITNDQALRNNLLAKTKLEREVDSFSIHEKWRKREHGADAPRKLFESLF